ncbi:MAG: hypothetical protein ACT4PE_07010 [Candidatus Eiseniibacteriota bacterium]
MIARKVSLHLKPHAAADLVRILEKEVIPLLRKQSGFVDEIAFASKNGEEAFGISLWDRKESADAYDRSAYPRIAKMLEALVEGTPELETFEVTNSTFHRIIASPASRRAD